MLGGRCGFIQIMFPNPKETGPIGIHYLEHGKNKSHLRAAVLIKHVHVCAYFVVFSSNRIYNIRRTQSLQFSWKAGLDAFSVLDKASLSRQAITFCNH